MRKRRCSSYRVEVPSGLIRPVPTRLYVTPVTYRAGSRAHRSVRSTQPSSPAIRPSGAHPDCASSGSVFPAGSSLGLLAPTTTHVGFSTKQAPRFLPSAACPVSLSHEFLLQLSCRRARRRRLASTTLNLLK